MAQDNVESGRPKPESPDRDSPNPAAAQRKDDAQQDRSPRGPSGDVPADMEASAEQLLADVGLAKRAKHRIHELSGGEMQRVAIARAMILGPRLILADEPTGNLDSQTAASVLDLLKHSCETAGTTLVMVTHDRHAATAGDRIVSLRDGRVVSDQRTHELATEGAAE